MEKGTDLWTNSSKQIKYMYIFTVLSIINPTVGTCPIDHLSQVTDDSPRGYCLFRAAMLTRRRGSDPLTLY